jgi:hypothetical protein
MTKSISMLLAAILLGASAAHAQTTTASPEAATVSGTGTVAGNGNATGTGVAVGKGTATGKGAVVYRDKDGKVRVKRGEGTVDGRGIAVGKGTVDGKARVAGRGQATGKPKAPPRKP